MPDDELLDLFHVNSEKAFNMLLKQYTGFGYSIVYNKTSSVCTREDVEECVSDIFAKFYYIATAENPEILNVKAYLMVLAKRLAIDYFRKATAKYKIHSIPIGECDVDIFATSEDIGFEAMRKAENEIILNAVQSLGEPDSTIIFRKFFLQETDKQIGVQLRLTKNAVNKRIHRSLKKLRDILGGGI